MSLLKIGDRVEVLVGDQRGRKGTVVSVRMHLATFPIQVYFGEPVGTWQQDTLNYKVQDLKRVKR